MNAHRDKRGRRCVLFRRLGFAGAAAAGCALFLYGSARLAAELLPAPPLLENLSWSTAVFDAEGRLLRLSPAADGRYRLPIERSGVNPALLRATLAYEDRRFFSHPGVDAAALVRAAFETLTGPRPIGASTITMQVARMRLGLETRSVLGKLRQMFEALRYEAHYEKEEILSAYLTLAPYGGNVEGAAAAALVWFGKDAASLSDAEAIALSVIPQNPAARRPAPDNKHWEKARRAALARLVDAGEIEPARAEALRTPLAVRSVSNLPFFAPHNVRLLERRAREAGRSGILHSTLRGSLQTALERVLKQHVERTTPLGIRNAAAAVLDLRTRTLVAHVGSADFFNASISGEVDALEAPRSPGSTLKPLVYGLALDQGLIHSATVLVDRPTSFFGYAPSNSDGGFRGPISASDALVESRNVPAADLARQLSPDLYDALRSAGIELPRPREHYGLSIVLGGAETTMLDLLRLYALASSDGVARPVGIAAEPALFAGPSERVPILSREAAFILRRMLASRGERLRTPLGTFELLYKTGTSNGFRDAWCAGSVGPYVIVVWLGAFDGAPNPHLKGADVAVPLWKSAAAALLAEDRTARPERDDPQALSVSRESVCRATGDLGHPLCRDRVDAWFIPGRSPVRDTGVLRELPVDIASGRLACREEPGRTERRLFEVWPPEYREVFRAAGIVRPAPPAPMPGCGPETGAAPVIQSPEQGLAYRTQSLDAEGRPVARLVLSAAASEDVKTLYWFEEARLLCTSPRGEVCRTELGAGAHRITLVDDAGRSAEVHITVERGL